MGLQWKPIKGFELDYEISNQGDVRRIRYIKGSSKKELPYMLSKRINNSGYVHYVISNGDISKNVLAHRLVAEHFIENDNPLRNQINHKNGNKQDNRVENLEWVTQSENAQHNLKEMKYVQAKRFRPKKVAKYSIDGQLIATYNSIREACNNNGLIPTRISNCCNNKPHHKTYKGFIWKFCEE